MPKLGSPIHLSPNDDRWVLGSLPEHHVIKQVFIRQWATDPSMCVPLVRHSEKRKGGWHSAPYQNTLHPPNQFSSNVIVKEKKLSTQEDM